MTRVNGFLFFLLKSLNGVQFKDASQIIYNVFCTGPIAKFGDDAQDIAVETRTRRPRPHTNCQFPFQDCAHSLALGVQAAETNEHHAMNWIIANEPPAILEIFEFCAAFQDVANGRKHVAFIHHSQ